MNIQVNALVNAAVYILPGQIPATGVFGPGLSSLGGLIGQAAEVELPHPKSKMTEYKGLGLVFDLDLWVGIDKMESTIKWASYNPSVIAQIVNPLNSVYLLVMGNITSYTSGGAQAQLPVIYIMGGIFNEPGNAMVKKMEQSELSSKMVVYHAEEYISGIQTFMADVFSNQLIVGGVDLLAAYRANLGG